MLIKMWPIDNNRVGPAEYLSSIDIDVSCIDYNHGIIIDNVD